MAEPIGTDFIPTYDDIAQTKSVEPNFRPGNAAEMNIDPSLPVEPPPTQRPFMPENANDGAWMAHQIEQALQYSEDPEGDRARIYSASWLQDKLGGHLSIQQIMADPDRYMSAYAGQDILPETFWGFVENDFKRGSLSVAIGHMGLGMMIDGDPESFDKIKNILSQIPPVSEQERGFVNKAMGSIAQLLPPMAATGLATWAGAKTGGALAGGKGAVVGGMITGGVEAATLATGNIYVDILMMDDPETGRPMWDVLREQAVAEGGDADEAFRKFNRMAAIYASGGGILSGIIEMVQLDLVTGGKILDDVVGKHLVEIAEKAWTSQYMKNSFSRFIVNHGLNVGEEVLQEMVQESAEWWSNELAQRDIARDLEVAGYEPAKIDEFMTHMKEVVETTASAMLFMGAPGSVIMTGQQKVYASREARGADKITWENVADSAFIELSELNFQRPGKEEMAAAEAQMNKRESERPIRVEELETGEVVVAPEDRARAAVLEEQGVTNIPVQIQEYSANIAPDMDAQVMAQANDFRYDNNQIFVENQSVVERLQARNPEQFRATDNGIEYVNLVTQEVTPIRSEVSVAVQESGLTELIQELERRREAMPADVLERFDDLKTQLAQMERTGNISQLAVALQDDEVFGIPLSWFGDQDAKKFSELQSVNDRVEELAAQAIPVRQDEFINVVDDVIPFDADKRALFDELKAQRLQMNASTNPELLQRVDEELKALAEHQENPTERRVREATRRGTKVTDETLARYADRPWAAAEIKHRALLAETSPIYDAAAAYDGDIDSLGAYLESDTFWELTPNGEALKQQFLDLLPDEPEGRQHFYEALVERSYFKTERNIEGFIESVSTDEGLIAWLSKVANSTRTDLTSRMSMAIDRMARGQELTARQLSGIRNELLKNAGYWQPRFLEMAAQTDEDARQELRAQKDYEYLRSRREATAARQNDTAAIADLKAQFAEDGVDFGYQLAEDRKILFIGKIVVSEDNRGQGLGSKAMEDLVDFADARGYQLQLTPSDAWGSSVEGLRKFYKKFGFVENKGKNKNFEVSNEMYRNPTALADLTEDGLTKYINNQENKLKALQETVKSARSEASLQRREAVRRKAQEVRENIRAAKQLREGRLLLAKQISKPAPRSVNLKYRDLIINLQGLLDPGFRSKKNTELWQQENEALWEKYKDTEWHELVAKYKMKPRPLNLWTVEELQALKDEIYRLKETGRAFQAEWENMQSQYHRDVRETWLADEFSDVDPLPTVGSQEYKKVSKGKPVNHVRFHTWRPPRVFRMLDGWKEGGLYNMFVTKTNKKYDEALAMTTQRRNAMHNKMEELGIRFTDLAHMTTLGDENFSRDALVNIYMYEKNEKARRAMREGNGLTEAQIASAIDQLTDSERALGDYLIDEFNQHYRRLEKVYEIFMGEHMKKEPAYFPMMRVEKSWEQDSQDFWDQFNVRNEYTNTSVNRSMTKERSDLYGKQSGVQLGAVHIWTQQVEKHEHWMALGTHVRDMGRVLKRWQTKDALRSKYGNAAYKFMEKYIDAVANPTAHKGHDAMSMFSRALRKNMAVAYLSYNMVTMAKQIPSIALFLRDVGPLRLMTAAAKYVANYNEMKQFVDMHDPQMANRVMTREMELIRQKEKGTIQRAIGGIGRAGMVPIQKIDSAVTHIGWLAVYDMHKSQGHAEATRRAQMAVLETQPSARAKDLAQLYRSGEITNWITMFSNQLNNIWNIATSDTVYAWKNKEYGRLVGMTTGIAISTISMMFLAGWRPGEDDEEKFALEFGKQLSNMIPVVGKSVSSGVDGWQNNTLDILPVASEIGNLYREVFEWDGEDITQGLLDIGRAAGVTGGLPVTAARRGREFIEEGADWRELFGPVFEE
jgi:GNAT superfamily N-acetyltransferase